MNSQERIWRFVNHIEPFDEQSSQASTPETGCFDASGASSNREDVYTRSDDVYTNDDFSCMAGCLE